MYIYTYVRTKKPSQYFDMENLKVLQRAGILSPGYIILNSSLRALFITAALCARKTEE